MKFYITGGNKLFGSVKIQSAKNSVVALISASILSNSGVFIKNCPKIYDVACMLKILQKMGATVIESDFGVYIDASALKTTIIPEKLSKKVRASLFMVGAILGKYKQVSISQTGGCPIGSRPLDIHIEGLKKLGAKISEDNGYLKFEAVNLKGANIRLKYPSVGATENIIMAGCLSEGTTIIENCALEPEIVDLQIFLNRMGAKITGAGTSVIRIDGVKKLGGVEFLPLPDRIETGTFMLAVASCGGEVELKGAKWENNCILNEKLLNNACKIYNKNDIIYIRVNKRMNGFGEIITSPYPGFPTDLQPLVVACGCGCDGKTIVRETVFESRFAYTQELKKMGAKISCCGDTLEVIGSTLVGANVVSPDLRGGASLCLAGLMAQGKTVVDNIRTIERGYENFDEKLSMLGAKIVKK